jgi:hypothetical protein
MAQVNLCDPCQLRDRGAQRSARELLQGRRAAGLNLLNPHGCGVVTENDLDSDGSPWKLSAIG